MTWRMYKAVLLAVMVLALGASEAGATASPEEAAPSVALPSVADPLDSPILRGAEAVAEEYWASRGIALPPLEGAYELPAEEQWAGDTGVADPSSGRFWLAAEVLEFMHSSVHQVNVRSRVILCYVVLHERGHNAGLQHSDGETFPIMTPSNEAGAGWLRKGIAPRCWTWAKHPFG